MQMKWIEVGGGRGSLRDGPFLFNPGFHWFCKNVQVRSKGGGETQPALSGHLLYAVCRAMPEPPEAREDFAFALGDILHTPA